jgi:hypothetical protein
MTPISEYLVTEKAHLTPMEVLRAGPGALLGVSADAVAALDDIAVPTVFDLAASRIFANAHMLYEAATDPRSMLARYGMAPADVLDALPPGMSLDQLRNQPIAILEGIDAAAAAKLTAALSVTTVRDLALWPPYLAAQAIVRAVFFPDEVPGGDPEAPADLLPKSGEFPTERIFYSTLVFDGFDGDPGQLAELNGPVALEPVTMGDEFGFKKPGIGALLTMMQSWYAQGVALGQLLHSVALAPGESTRLAMIDWSRRSTGRQDEAVGETESLSNATEHSRALSEVTSAVAQEAQSGFSETEANSWASQSGSAGGFSLGPITIGESGGSARGGSKAMSFSSSSGRRDLSASMTQNVVDRTQQHASAARNRRATVVKEISQTERDQVSSRVVTNYNHMHALSVQYYEVVQIYRVSVGLARVEKCLFVPMRLVDFRNPDLVRRFRDALRAAAIDPDAAALLGGDMDTVLAKNPAGSLLALNNPFGLRAEARDGGKTLALPDEARLTQLTVIRSRGGINDLPKLSDITVRLRDGSAAELNTTTSGTKDEVKVIDRPALREISHITMTSPANPSDNQYNLTFALNYKGTMGWFTGSLLVTPGAPVTVLTLTGGGVWQNLVDHLMANRLHYSQAVFRSLDPATVTLLLSNYSYKGKPVTVQIDPQPVTTAGNYLVFKTHVNPDADTEEGAAWKQWLDEHGVSFKDVKEDLVPLPSGGVFAEAVLGRYNGAEKLDITRFWNWQDSPIPLVAPEIAPLQLGSRGTEEDLKAQPFSQPLINIVNPTSLPDPVGMAGVLQAIQNGNMFRDMSGLAATIGLAQAGMQTTADAATAANTQAGSNMATAAKKEVEMFKAALAFAGAVMGKGSPDTSPSTISNEGAKINQGRSMDQRGVPAQSGAGGGAAPGAIPADGSSGGGGDAGAPGGAPWGAPGGGGSAAGGSNEQAAFRRALWGSQGESQGDAQRNLLAFAVDAGAADAAAAGPAFNPGPFKEFVDTNRLDLDIADVLRSLDEHPADSWAKQTAAFAHHELKNGNLHGIFRAANVAKAKALVPASYHAGLDSAVATIGNAFTTSHIGGPGAYKGVTIISNGVVDAGRTAGAGREFLALVLTHELTHFRNRDFFIALQLSTPGANPTYYVDLAKANAHANTQERPWYIMGELVCNHVSWRVQQDLRHKATGAAIKANPDKKGFFRYALALNAAGKTNWPDNGYLADLEAAGKFRQQIAEWLQKIGGEKALYHDDPAKNAAVRQFMKDVYDEVKPAFAVPAEAAEGGA